MPIVPFDVSNWFRHEVDGGWAWIVVSASFIIQMILFGIIQSYGTMFVALLNDFKSGEYETAWVGSMAYGLMFFTGPISATLSEHFGCRKMVYIGTLVCMISCISSSFAPNLSTLYFTFGVLWGIGGGLTFFPCILVLNFYFAEKISLANGITMTGAGIGTLMFNAVLNKIVEVYDWRVGFQLLGGVCAVMFACGSAYRPPPADFYAIEEWQDYQQVKFTTKLARVIDIRPWKEKAFVVWLIGISLVLFGYFIPYVHLVRFGQTLNVPLSKGTLLVGYMSISQIFAKLLCGRLADMRRVKRLQILVVAILCFAICNFAVTAAKDFGGLLTYALFFGFSDGLFVVVLPLLIRDLVGRELMANAIGNFYGIMSIPLTLGPPISGQLYDAFGSYNAPFAAAGALMLVSCFIMYFVYRLKPELIKDLPPQQEDFLTSDLITRPSIHSHTVDALSGMFLTERFSTWDRSSQLIINPLHNLTSTLSRSRAGSLISSHGRPAIRFPSFAFDLRSEGRSEIFLQRLRGNIEGASMGSLVLDRQQRGRHLSVSTSLALSDRDATSTKDISLDLSKGDVVITSTPNISSTTLAAEPIAGSTPMTQKDIMPRQLVVNNTSVDNHVKSHPEDAAKEDSRLQELSFETQEPEKGNNRDNLEIPCLLKANLAIDTPEVENQVLVEIGTEKPKANSASIVVDINKIDLTDDTSTSPIKSSPIDGFPGDNVAPINRTSSPIPQTFSGTRTATLISIDSDNGSDTIDEMNTTLVPDDTETTTETITPGDLDISINSDDDDNAMIRLPPPPIWHNDPLLVDLIEPVNEWTYDIRTATKQNDTTIKGILNEECSDKLERPQNDIDVKAEEDIIIRLPPPPTKNREPLVAISDPVAEDQQILNNQDDANEESHANTLAIDSPDAASTHTDGSTDFISLNERLEVMAEQQRQEGELQFRFPSDEMTLFATYRSNIVTPAEYQATPACQSISQTPAPSTGQSPPITPAHGNFPDTASYSISDVASHQNDIPSPLVEFQSNECSDNQSQEHTNPFLQKTFQSDINQQPFQSYPEVKTTSESTNNTNEDVLLSLDAPVTSTDSKPEEVTTVRLLMQQTFLNDGNPQPFQTCPEAQEQFTDRSNTDVLLHIATTATSTNKHTSGECTSNPFMQQSRENDDNQQPPQSFPEMSVQAASQSTENRSNDKVLQTTIPATAAQPDGSTNLFQQQRFDSDMQQPLQTYSEEQITSASTASIDNHAVFNTTPVSEECKNIDSTNPFPIQRQRFDSDMQQPLQTYSEEQITSASTASIDNHAIFSTAAVSEESKNNDSINPFPIQRFEDNAPHQLNPFVSESEHADLHGYQDVGIQSKENIQETNAINVPLTKDRKSYRKQSLVLDDNSDFDQSSSNSLVNVFEIELDEVIRDEHKIEGRDGGSLLLNNKESKSISLGNETAAANPFAVELEHSLQEPQTSILPSQQDKNTSTDQL